MPHNAFLQIWNFLIFWCFQEEFMCTFAFFSPQLRAYSGKKLQNICWGQMGMWKVTCILVPVCVFSKDMRRSYVLNSWNSSKILMIRQIVTCLPESWRCIWTSNSWVRLGDLLPPDNNKIFCRILNGPPA